MRDPRLPFGVAIDDSDTPRDVTLAEPYARRRGETAVVHTAPAPRVGCYP